MCENEINKVLDFWFGSKTSKDYLKMRSFWYGSKTDDDFVRKHLSDSYSLARNGLLDHWMEAGEGEGALALIILLDQVPRNIFRDTPQAYATDPKALSIAKYIVEKGWDKQMNGVFRRYVYSPFNHSENLEDQKKSLQLFSELGDSSHMYWVQSHYDLIRQYGRFPHRDHILGRHSNT